MRSQFVKAKSMPSLNKRGKFFRRHPFNKGLINDKICKMIKIDRKDLNIHTFFVFSISKNNNYYKLKIK